MSSISSPCANPLYLQWIREWWDIATNNNAKDRLTYKGAWESMKANPIEFTHPSEAIKLRGIGPKLVRRLTEKLQNHCRENGLEMPKEPSKIKKRSIAETDQDNEDGNDSQEATKRAKKPPKGYVPKLRSGGYALLLTLSELPEGQTVGLTKAELQIQAQPHADSSFTVPPDPSKFHTAWNSMGTLESKHLVYTFGRPVKKYALTDEGWLIAKSMKQTSVDGVKNPESIPLAAAASSVAQPTRQTLTTQRRHVIDIDDDDDDEEGDSINPISNLVSFEGRIRKKFGSRETFQKFMNDRAFGLATTADEESLSLMREFAERATNGTSSINGSNSTTHNGKASTSQLPASIKAPKVPTRKLLTNHFKPVPSEDVSGLPHRPSLANPEVVPSYNPIVVKPGTFTVELVLDSREVRAKTDRNYIQDQFNKSGLRCEQRALQVGDMIWTARIHDPGIIQQLEAGDRKIPEIVLDYVVERKRLDDLDSSIKDSRFLEQKFRLKRSGIKNKIYIIEDYGSISAMDTYQHTRMVTAIAATQVIDGFFVKRTKKLDETITYLANMTKVLKEMYESKTLLLIPSSILTPRNHFLLRDSPEGQRYITYEAQAGLASKSATLTSRDIFLKMLMCTRGTTGDKAIEIQKHWSVPRELIEGYESLPHADQKHNMVWNKTGNYKDKRKTIKATSQKIAEIWGK